MNFFGHAAVASWRDDAPGLALGAMLPDFATMLRAALADQHDRQVAAGVALHHATDAVFHRAPAVVGLFRDAEARLYARGVRKGPTRAAAHVGVELLLDGVLLDEPRYRAGYLAALDHPGPVAWRDDDGAARFATLQARLRAYGAPDDLTSGPGVAHRLARALAGRRLLEPTGPERAAIAAVMTDLVERVTAAAPTVLTQVRAGLAAR